MAKNKKLPNQSLMNELAAMTTPELCALYHGKAPRVAYHPIRRELATRSDTPAEIFKALSESDDQATRKGLAINPSAPLTVLINSIEHAPEEFLKNPILPLLLLEDPGLNQVPDRALFLLSRVEGALRILRGPILQRSSELVYYLSEPSPALLQLLAEGSDEQGRCQIAAHEKTPRATLQYLSLDPSEEVRMVVARNQNIPSVTLAVLARDSASQVREGAAQNLKIPISLLEMLSLDTSAEVLRWVVAHPNISSALLEKMFYDPRQLHKEPFASNPKTPTSILSRLAREGEFLYELARNSSTPAESLELILREKYGAESPIKILAALAENPQTTTAMLRQLATMGTYARRSVASNARCPRDLLARLTEDEDELTRSNAKETANRGL